MSVYKQPLYYEIAFSFIDPKKQVDFFEKLIKRFSKVEIRRFLDIACGPSLQLREIARRGYETVGLDSNPEMVDYLKGQAGKESLDIKTINADMVDFRLEEKADFAFIMMGSLNVESNQDFLNHLDSVANSLNKGGLYFIQNQGLDWTRPAEETWTMRRKDVEVKTTFEGRFTNIINQTYREKLTLVVDDKGDKKSFVHEEDLKFIFPQEFRTLVSLNGRFEFLGWWQGNCNTWHLNKSLEEADKLDNNMVLLRKKA